MGLTRSPYPGYRKVWNQDGIVRWCFRHIFQVFDLSFPTFLRLDVDGGFLIWWYPCSSSILIVFFHYTPTILGYLFTEPPIYSCSAFVSSPWESLPWGLVETQVIRALLTPSHEAFVPLVARVSCGMHGINKIPNCWLIWLLHVGSYRPFLCGVWCVFFFLMGIVVTLARNTI